MNSERQLTDEDREHVQNFVLRLRGSGSWADATRALNEFARERREEVTAETLRNAGDNGIAGLKLRRLVDRYEAGKKAQEATQGAPPRVVELDERYHTVAIVFARARAAGVREETLAAARLRLGLAYSDNAPTERAVLDAIKAEERAIKELRHEVFDLGDE